MNTSTRPFSKFSASFVALFASILAATPVHAHHLMDGKTASTAFEGFMSGLAHPVIGVDHLVMIVAIGILAAAMRPGFLLAAAFVVAAMAGTGLHLLNFNLPGSELLVAFSVVAVGSLLVLRRTLSPGLVVAICAVAGVLHGYAYGESIFGAETTPLTAYLVGFTVVQLAVAGAAYAIAKGLREKAPDQAFSLRPAGFVVAGAGLALLATQVLALTFPI